jgi:hypothetical protein
MVMLMLIGDGKIAKGFVAVSLEEKAVCLADKLLYPRNVRQRLVSSLQIISRDGTNGCVYWRCVGLRLISIVVVVVVVVLGSRREARRWVSGC